MIKTPTIPSTVQTATQKVLPNAKGKSMFMVFFFENYTIKSYNSLEMNIDNKSIIKEALLMIIA